MQTTVRVNVETEQVLDELSVEELLDYLQKRTGQTWRDDVDVDVNADIDGLVEGVERLLLCGRILEALDCLQRWRRPKFASLSECLLAFDLVRRGASGFVEGQIVARRRGARV